MVSLCAYEAVAILTGQVPTITSLCWRARNTWTGRVVIWLGMGYLAYHLLVEQDGIANVVEALVSD